MENNLNNKAKFFAQYFGQNVFKVLTKEEQKNPMYNGFPDVYEISPNNLYNRDIKNAWLELNSMSNINNDDAFECLKILNNNKKLDYLDLDLDEVKENIADFLDSKTNVLIGTIYIDSILKLFDYLRTKGYALPFIGISVEEQIEYGWIKLKI